MSNGLRIGIYCNKSLHIGRMLSSETTSFKETIFFKDTLYSG